ncbi:MAG: ABC transporter substrate-binding protein [Mesorhizobium sp.]|uniref:ABC transporter substrate-binding protein n=1 Tax=Mesorhizobium sp. TaxID=1871066 RepID=UPI00120AE3AB|nr:ABC transporter substrate-binding protein [Mesorhizobium sp.]TIR02497.1 MAG: ABC transporter substrate-binding protein [Mesorhizobium sp.]
MKSFLRTLTLGAAMALCANIASAAELTFATGWGFDFYKVQIAKFEKATGNKVKLVHLPAGDDAKVSQYRLWLAAGDNSIDVLRMDNIWLPGFANDLVDLTNATKDVISQHVPSIVTALSVDGKLLAMPMEADAPLLYYRKDLLEKYGKVPPKTWDELTAIAREIQDKERAAGNPDMWGYLFQGKGTEELTCNALEWIKSSGGGSIVDPDGTISINNKKAIAAIDRAKGWIDTISPPGALAYDSEAARGVWQVGNGVFLRNWVYIWGLSDAADSPIKGKFSGVPLPADPDAQSAPCLGVKGNAVSKYSEHQKEAIEFVKFLASEEVQKDNVLQNGALPTLPTLFDDKDIVAAQPYMPTMKGVLENGLVRPSAIMKAKYNEASTNFWTVVNDTLAGKGSAADNLERLEVQLTNLKGSGW